MSPTMYCSRASKSFHPDSLKSRVSFDLAAASPLFLRNSSELIGVRPIPRTSNCGFMQPSHARLYRPGISLRFVRSPEAPKIIRTHESPVGIGSCDNFSRGLAWMMADIIVSSSRCTSFSFESESGSYLLPRAPLSIVAELGPRPFAYERQSHRLRSALHPSALSSGKSHDHEWIPGSREPSGRLSYQRQILVPRPLPRLRFHWVHSGNEHGRAFRGSHDFRE